VEVGKNIRSVAVILDSIEKLGKVEVNRGDLVPVYTRN